LALDLLGGGGGGGAATAAAAADTPGSLAPGAAGSGGSGGASTAQRTGLALLVCCCPLLQHPAAGVEVAGCERFWELLRACLVLPGDADALERKRALLLLQRLAPAGGQLQQSGGWALWQALYDILDEFPIHLVAPMWAKIDQLHAPAPEYRTEAVVPKSYIPRKKEL
ncbi:hypothetical protein Agub_g386, partial [Astrephomene gubernaculifera]